MHWHHHHLHWQWFAPAFASPSVAIGGIASAVACRRPSSPVCRIPSAALASIIITINLTRSRPLLKKPYLNGFDVLNHRHERLLADPFVDLDEQKFGLVTHGLITIFEKWNDFR